MKTLLPAIFTIALLYSPVAAQTEDDRTAIMTLLDTYQAAVTYKDAARFERLLLAKDIPFSSVPSAPTAATATGWQNYEGFRRSVFIGAPFTQTFHDIVIRQHGALADVDLVFVNDTGKGKFSGWKTLQLLKIDGEWKIASEFFTALPRDKKDSTNKH